MPVTVDYAAVIDDRRKARGLTVPALSKQSGIGEEALRAILDGKRKLKASELLSLSAVLALTFEDYHPRRAV